jgi:hypothetical protein
LESLCQTLLNNSKESADFWTENIVH